MLLKKKKKKWIKTDKDKEKQEYNDNNESTVDLNVPSCKHTLFVIMFLFFYHQTAPCHLDSHSISFI